MFLIRESRFTHISQLILVFIFGFRSRNDAVSCVRYIVLYCAKRWAALHVSPILGSPGRISRKPTVYSRRIVKTSQLYPRQVIIRLRRKHGRCAIIIGGPTMHPSLSTAHTTINLLLGTAHTKSKFTQSNNVFLSI